jgi:hypothetical protein
MRIDIGLDADDIDTAILKLKKYRDGLQGKLDRFVDELADIGIDVIDNITSFIPQDQEMDKGSVSKEPRPATDGRAKMVIRFSSEDALFIEFSAGITYGTNSYPLPSGKGYGMGTYNPSGDRWSNPDGWWYKDESGELHHSYGNPAYMPMYHAIEDMTLQIWATAYKIFWTGV